MLSLAGPRRETSLPKSCQSGGCVGAGMTKSYAVTGASGFIGRAVVKKLASLGLWVTAWSRLPGFRIDGIESAEVQSYESCPKADVIIHLAESRDRSFAAARGEQHIIDTTRVVRHLTGQATEALIYASSALVYGDRSPHPRKVSDQVAPQTAYEHAKLACERLVLSASGSALRLANVYGPDMASESVLGEILAQVKSGSSFVSVRDGSHVRDFSGLRTQQRP